MATRKTVEESKVKVEKIAIRMGDKVVELEVEDARKLLGLLKDLFGYKTEVVTWPIYIDRWYPYWYSNSNDTYSWKGDTNDQISIYCCSN